MSELTGREIAVVGMAGRFPGARNLDELWRNLREGKEAVTPLSDEELRRAGVSEAMIAHPDYVKAASRIDDPDLFDAPFFGYTAAEAEILDPQQRLFLEHVWEALEDAGHAPGADPGLVGVYAGVAWNTYLLSNLREHPELFEGAGGFQVFITNDKDFMPTRASYKLDLKGPSVIVQTSCSTSLVAIHLACLSLLSYECDTAVVGGVTVKVPQDAGYLHQEGGLASPDGHCRAFDARAAGTIFGSGVGVAVLKRLDDARADGDRIRAVVKGSAINNDGAAKVSYTAPGVEGQAAVIATAQAVAEVDPRTIGYVEAHGTGTSLGDPIEVSALTRVFRRATDDVGFCALGSVKSNLGHLDAAAGIAGFLKTVLALEHREIPPTLNVERPNPAIDFGASPFRVVAEREDWPEGHGGAPRRAGVSSFGVGGTNAHVILEEAPPAPASAPAPRPWHLLPLSARSEDALDQATERLRARLEADETLDGPALADAAYTLAVGRTVFRHRRFLVCQGRGDALDALSGRAPGRLRGAVDSDDPRARPVVFLFPGQGSQHPEMARDLYAHDPVFRREMERALAAVPDREPEVRDLLRSLVAGEPPAAERLEETRFAQPALFAVEHALATSWMAWGVRPRAMVGHSIGEFVAAVLAGVLSFEDGMALVIARGRLVQACPRGAMLAVPLAEAELTRLLPEGVSLAAVNEPDRSVASGPEEGIAALARALEEQGIEGRRLHTSHAFHSDLMEPAVEPLREVLSRIELRPPEIPYPSNVTGTWITPEEATDPNHWLRHLRRPVRFEGGVAEILARPDGVLLEVGPGRTLTTLVSRHPARDRRPVIASLPHPRDLPPGGDGAGPEPPGAPSVAHRMEALGRLWLAGVPVDWAAIHGEGRLRVPLPTYPFQRRRYWIEGRVSGDGAGETRAARAESPAGSGEPEKRSEPADWLYLPSWRPEALPAPSADPEPAEETAPPLTLLFAPEGAGRTVLDRLAAFLADPLAEPPRRVVTVEPGDRFAILDVDRYSVPPVGEEGYAALLDGLGVSGEAVTAAGLVIVHAWSLGPEEGAASPDPGSLADLGPMERGAGSLLDLTRVLIPRLDGAPAAVRLLLVADRMEAITPAEERVPSRAALPGLARVFPQEHPEIAARAVDLPVPAGSAGSGRANDGALRQAARSLAAELRADWSAGSTVVAYRGRQRWVPSYEPLEGAGDAEPPAEPFRREGVYLLTGGLTGDGLGLAGFLAREHAARLILLEPPDGNDGEAAEAVRELQAAGGEVPSQVMVVTAALSDDEAVRRAVAAGEERFGPLHGVIHAAGTQGEATFRTLRETGSDELRELLADRVRGAVVLDRVLGDDPDRELDFAVALSSLAGVLGGLAYGPFAAANRVLEAFVEERSRRAGRPDPPDRPGRGGLPWRTVTWDAWRTTEPDRDGAAGRGGITEVRGDLAELVMEREEGEEAFRRAVAVDGAERVLVSTADLPTRIAAAAARHRERSAAGGRATEAAHPGELHPRPDLETPFARPESDAERTIAAVWGRALGFREVGLDDNFFELGGDSFLAVRVASRLRDELEVELPVARLYQGLTVRALAASLAEGDGAERRAAQLEERKEGRDLRRAAAARRRGRQGRREREEREGVTR